MNLESCWYLSPPWREEKLNLKLEPFQLVYLTQFNRMAYCCGYKWRDGELHYALIDNENESFFYPAILEAEFASFPFFTRKDIPEPEYHLGDIVHIPRSQASSESRRIILGIMLISGKWNYFIEIDLPREASQESCFGYFQSSDLSVVAP